MNKAATKRIKVTKTGKVLKRTMGLGHFRAKKKSTQMNRKKGFREITEEAKNILRYQ